MKPYISEVIGTCIFTLVLILATAANPWVATIFAVFTLMFLAYGFGHVSGAYVNPALAIGAMLTNKLSPLKTLYYVIAEIAGAALAILIIKYAKIATPGTIENIASWKLFSAELAGTILFGYGVAAVTFGKVHKAASGFVVGLSLFAGIILSSLFLNGTALSASLNPAIAFGLKSFNAATILGPILGAIIGFWLFVYLGESAIQTWRGLKDSFKRLAPAPAAHGGNTNNAGQASQSAHQPNPAHNPQFQPVQEAHVLHSHEDHQHNRHPENREGERTI